jgi:outer membrane protein assembly factor BamB
MTAFDPLCCIQSIEIVSGEKIPDFPSLEGTMTTPLLFVGIRGRVLALDHDIGAEIWRAELGSDVVTVVWDGEALFAATSGEIWRLDPQTGGQIWHNKLKGLGRMLISIASSRAPSGSPSAEITELHQRAADAAIAAATTG